MRGKLLPTLQIIARIHTREAKAVDTTEKTPHVVNTRYPKPGLQFSHTHQKINMINNKSRMGNETKIWQGKKPHQNNSQVLEAV